MDSDFQAYVLARRRSLLRTAWLLTGDWDRAEDLVQSALLRCYPHWDRIAVGDPDAYVRRALARLATSWWRRRWRGEVATGQLPDRADRDMYAQVDLRLAVLAALAQLPARQRAAVVLRYLDDLTEAQTAAALDCSVGTVKSQTAAGLTSLRAAGLQPLRTGRDVRDGRPAAIELDLAAVVPEPPDTALPWERLRRRAARRQRRRHAAAAVAVVGLMFVGAGGLWRSTAQPTRVRLPVPVGTAVSVAPSQTPQGPPTARPAAPAQVRFGDVDGDNRPDKVTLISRQLTVSFATGRTATQTFPGSGGVPHLQAVSDLAGLRYAQILVGETAAGCCADRPVNLVSQLLVYEHGALEPVTTRGGQPFTLQFSSGRGEVYAGTTCRPGGRIEQDLAGWEASGGYTLSKTIYVITTATARVVSMHRSHFAGATATQRSMIRATRTHCPGLPLGGIPAGSSHR